MTLILTEKPSVARDFAAALNCKSNSGFFRSENYIVTNCVGHLLELYYPEDYDESLKKWKMETLPIVPKQFKHKPIASTSSQLRLIQKIIKDYSFDKIIIATDAGREGELIARLTLNHCGVGLDKAYRFWSSEALTPEVVKKGLAEIKPAGNYVKLYHSGYYRQLSDWLVGINLSRALSLKMNDVFSFGRVQTAVLFLIIKRYLDNKDFKPKDYFQLKGNFEKDNRKFTAMLYYQDEFKFDSKEMLLGMYAKVLDGKSMGVVRKVEKKEFKKAPPLLYNLTALQRAANRKFGYSAQTTLDVCQNLYETHKCLSYPRAPSCVLGESNVELVKNLVAELKTVYTGLFDALDESLITNTNKRVFNDKKLEDHHALIPLKALPESVGSEEKNIYNLVLTSFIAAFSPDFIYKSISVIIDVDKVEFRAKGREIIQSGWKQAIKSQKGEEDEEDEENEKQTLPELKEGYEVTFSGYEILSKKTKPKPLYTDDSILAAMENPEKLSMLEDSERDFHFEKDTGLGTQATRASIIETLRKRKYIERSKKKLLPTEKGLHLFTAVNKIPALSETTDVIETAKWETQLKSNPERFFKDTNVFIKDMINEIKAKELSSFAQEKAVIAKCPKCKNGNIFEGKSSFYCSEYKNNCDFTLWKKTFGVVLTKAAIKALLSGKATKPMKLKRKDGSEFTASLVLNDEFKIGFAPKNK